MTEAECKSLALELQKNQTWLFVKESQTVYFEVRCASDANISNKAQKHISNKDLYIYYEDDNGLLGAYVSGGKMAKTYPANPVPKGATIPQLTFDEVLSKLEQAIEDGAEITVYDLKEEF